MPVLEAKPLDRESPESGESLDSFMVDFEGQLSPQAKRWDDAIDQLLELFTNYLGERGVKPSEITTLQGELQKRLESDRELADRWMAKIHPRDEQTGELKFFPEELHWANKIRRAAAELNQPQPLRPSKEKRRLRPTIVEPRPFED